LRLRSAIFNRNRSLFLALALPLAVWTLALACPKASADVGVVLNESLDEDMDRITSTGHSAIYFSRVCPESPVKLRLCGPGESGSVMSNYINIGEDRSYEWNIVPLNIYLFGVEDPRNRPLFGSYKIKHLLEDRYRQNYLSALCTTSACINSQKSEWREMVAATLIRGVHIFYITTTVEEDAHFIAEWNDSANENHFNGVTNNCADFTRRAIGRYFPHATRTDYLNDFGMTSPKAVARTFTHFAEKHPDAQLRVMHFAQVPGTAKRSRIVRSGTEQLFHSGKLMLPEVLLAHFALPVVMTSYYTTARFNADTEFAKRPSSPLLDSSYEESLQDRRQDLIGTDSQWKNFRKSLDSMAAADGKGSQKKDLKRFFKKLDETGTPSLDADGTVWLDVSENGRPARLGLSASNITSGSATSTTYELLLARATHFAKSPAHARETMFEFEEDWNDLQLVSAQSAAGFSPALSARFPYSSSGAARNTASLSATH
jgi:hypothetical protein